MAAEEGDPVSKKGLDASVKNEIFEQEVVEVVVTEDGVRDVREVKARKRKCAEDDLDPDEILKTYYSTRTDSERIWYTCKTCKDYKTDFNSTMRDHVNSQHMRMMLKCSHCPFETLRFKTLNYHRRSKHNISAMCCWIDACSFKTILVERMRDHLIKRHHYESEEAKARVANFLADQSTDDQPARSLNDKLEMKCGKPKRVKRTGASGQRKTDDERQYRTIFDEDGKQKCVQCLYCDFTTKLASNMTGHVNAKHLGRQLECSECSFSTFYPKNLAVHVKKLHGRSTRQCFIGDCKFRFIQDERMHIHLMEKHSCFYDQEKNAIYVDVFENCDK